ncbi:MAG: MAPEG family protein [Alphaproteobacteria bacterium]|nr:MAPEG family protein [Alphaproteobacteria bacterium]
MTTTLMGPVLAQIGLTFLVFVLLYVRRLPAMAAAKPTPEQMQDKGNLQKLPAPARFAAENYNHQFEMPVLFYVLSIATMVVGLADDLSLMLAWAYVGLRAVHAIIHCTYNNVLHRFFVFLLSAMTLLIYFVHVALKYWGA